MATTTQTSASDTSHAYTKPSQESPQRSETVHWDQEWSKTVVNYYKDANTLPPDTLNSTLSEHEMRIARRSNESPHIDPTQIRVRNIRDHEHEYRLDKQGFTVAHFPSPPMQNWRDDQELKQVYFPAVTRLLKQLLGAKYVFQYEWHVRRETLESALQADSKGRVDINGPVRRVHIDESPASARNEFDYYYRPGEHGNEHLKDRRIAVYNVWKPLKQVRRDPLCLCDARTIKDEDLQSGKVTVPNVGEIENFAVRPPKHEGAHEFHYLRNQQPDEALVFRIVDERIDGLQSGKRSHGVAHTSFVDPGTESELPRESIEVRSFCVF